MPSTESASSSFDPRGALLYGKSFWQETDYRVKEITSTIEGQLESEMSAKLGARAASIQAGRATSETITETERVELKKIGQDVVTRAQVQDLEKILSLIEQVLQRRNRNYYIVIDGLDENWVDDRLRYRLIMALILTAKDFVKVSNVKVILALRRDLLERVFRLMRDSGFQEEKYQSLYLHINWTADEILDVLDRRIGHLVRQHYTKDGVGYSELLPKVFRGQDMASYIADIARRPRDVIAFFNTCILAADGLPKIGTKELKIAEGEYSRGRLKALASEWHADYPDLMEFARILSNKPASFKVGTLLESEIGDLCLRIATEQPSGAFLSAMANGVVETLISASDFRRAMIGVFYQVGLVGLKPAPHENESWADDLGRSVSTAEISPTTSVVVHPAYRRTLGIIT